MGATCWLQPRELGCISTVLVDLQMVGCCHALWAHVMSLPTCCPGQVAAKSKTSQFVDELEDSTSALGGGEIEVEQIVNCSVVTAAVTGRRLLASWV